MITITKILLTVYAICSTESDFRNVVNHDDGGSASYGICQIKAKTASWMTKKYGQNYTSDLMNRKENFNVALMYYVYQLRRYNGDERCAISAYNAGRCIKSNQNTYVSKVLRRREVK